MGLNLLGVLPLRLPSLDVDVRGLGLPPAAQAYLAGARAGRLAGWAGARQQGKAGSLGGKGASRHSGTQA